MKRIARNCSSSPFHLARLAMLVSSAVTACSSPEEGTIRGTGGAIGRGGGSSDGGSPEAGKTGDTAGGNGTTLSSTSAAQAIGGMLGFGGNSSSGGAQAGGSDSVGGAQGTGGSSLQGGASNAGGSRHSGGATQVGGTPSTGGAPATGGKSTAGGSQTAGGTTNSAGTSTAIAGGYPLKNPPVASSGCGKALSTFKAGTNTYKITSAGLNREYIVAIPDGYSANTPHRLVFGMHWMNGSADAVADWSKWFGLKALDTTNSTVFVAPNGYGSAPLWNQGAKDHTFFDDLVKLLESDLCIDTSRVFSVGFSFGAMFTNSLAQTHQDVLRGVVVYATADYNIYFPANTGKPLAYMGVHGLKDPTCPIASGRSSRDRFVKNNKCTVPSSVPEAKSGGTYVSYDYQCPSSFPVRWVTFDGKHTYPPNDTGTWVYGMTWEFITQF